MVNWIRNLTSSTCLCVNEYVFPLVLWVSKENIFWEQPAVLLWGHRFLETCMMIKQNKGDLLLCLLKNKVLFQIKSKFLNLPQDHVGLHPTLIKLFLLLFVNKTCNLTFTNSVLLTTTKAYNKKMEHLHDTYVRFRSFLKAVPPYFRPCCCWWWCHIIVALSLWISDWS